MVRSKVQICGIPTCDLLFSLGYMSDLFRLFRGRNLHDVPQYFPAMSLDSVVCNPVREYIWINIIHCQIIVLAYSICVGGPSNGFVTT